MAECTIFASLSYSSWYWENTKLIERHYASKIEKIKENINMVII